MIWRWLRKQGFSEVEPRQDLCYPFPLPRTEGKASGDGLAGNAGRNLFSHCCLRRLFAEA